MAAVTIRIDMDSFWHITDEEYDMYGDLLSGGLECIHLGATGGVHEFRAHDDVRRGLLAFLRGLGGPGGPATSDPRTFSLAEKHFVFCD